METPKIESVYTSDFGFSNQTGKPLASRPEIQEIDLTQLNTLTSIHEFLKETFDIIMSKELAVVEELNSSEEDREVALGKLNQLYPPVCKRIVGRFGSRYSGYGIRAGDEIIQCISKCLSKSKDVIVNATKGALETGSSTEDKIYDVVMTAMILFHLIGRPDDKLRIAVGLGITSSEGDAIDVHALMSSSPVGFSANDEIKKLMQNSARRFEKIHAWPADWKVKAKAKYDNSGDAKQDVNPAPPSKSRPTLVTADASSLNLSLALRSIQAEIRAAKGEEFLGKIVSAFEQLTASIIAHNKIELVNSVCMSKLDYYIGEIDAAVAERTTTIGLVSGLEGVTIGEDDDDDI